MFYTIRGPVRLRFENRESFPVLPRHRAGGRTQSRIWLSRENRQIFNPKANTKVASRDAFTWRTFFIMFLDGCLAVPP